MNANELSRRCLARARGEADGYELPEPTIGDHLDQLLDLRLKVASYAPWFRRGEPDQHMTQKKEQLADLEQFFADLRAERGIDDVLWQEMIVLRGEDPRQWRERIAHWQPQRFGTSAKWRAVYTLISPTGGRIWLTFEAGRWVQHEGFPDS